MVVVHKGPPVQSVFERASEMDEPTGDTTSMCIVGGGLSRRNLQEKLAREGITTGHAPTLITVDEIASDLIEAETGSLPRDLSDELAVRVIEEVLTRAEEGAYTDTLEEFAKTIPYSEEETLETLYTELNDYYRCTDASQDHDDLEAVAADLENVYARRNSQRRLEQFHELTEVLEGLVDELDEEVYVSRSHLVRKARSLVETHWQTVYGDVEWIGVATISIFDNPTLRLLLEIEETVSDLELNLFLGNGSFERQHNRLMNISGVLIEEEDTPQSLTSEAGQRLLDVATGQQVTLPETVDFVEAPERRREVEYVVKEVRKLLDAGVDPADIAILARNVDRYEAALRDVLETNQIPFHIDTHEPLAHAAGYRFINATFRLIQDAADGEEITYDQLTEPLRLGFCLPESNSSIWPLPQRIFLYLEQRLHEWEELEGTRPFSEWRGKIASASGWETAWDLMEEYIDWIAEQRGSPPSNGRDLRGLLRRLLGTHIYLTVPRARSRPHGPGVDLTRTQLNETHSTAKAEQVYKLAANAGRYYDYIQTFFDIGPGWDEAGRAIGEVIGSEQIRSPNTDANAIRVLAAGDAHFLDVAHTYLLGMSTDEFPVELELGAFLHDELRSEVAKRSESGDVPFLRLQADRTQYNVDLDYYENALRTSTDRITLVHHYKDSEGRSVEWSSFIDILPLDELATSVRVDEWLPEPHRNGSEGATDTIADSWADVSAMVSEKDRIRLLYHHAQRPWPDQRPAITTENIREIASQTDHEAIQAAVPPRYERYTAPPTEIQVSPDEPAFDNGLSIDDVVGAPIRTQELDLFSQCQLKFYFYQFLFNYNGEDIQRDNIPYYSSRRPHHRLGSLPHIIRHHYVSHYLDDAWMSFITTNFRDRYQFANTFDSVDDLEEWFEQQDDLQARERQMLPALKNEWELIRQEQGSEAPIDRQWSWQEPQTVTIEGTDVRIGGYRRDILNNSGGYALPVMNVRHSTYGEKALKHCWRSNERQYREEECSSLCQSCGEVEDCDYTTKFMLDHRLHVISNVESDLAGVIYQEHYRRGPDARNGVIKRWYLDDIREGIEDGPEGNIPTNALSRQAWYAREGIRNDDLATHVRELADGEHIFRWDQGFVQLGGCESCVYKDMCMIPNRGV